MKSTIVISLFVLFSFQNSTAQVNSPDSMIHKMFATLQAKDEKAYLALYPSAGQFKVLMRSMMEQMLKSEEMQKMMALDEKTKNLNVDSLINEEISKMDKPGVYDGIQKGFTISFKNIIEKGEKKGVDWRKAVLLNYTMDTISPLNRDVEILNTAGVKNMKGVIDFKVGDSLYHMMYDKVLLIPSEGGWFGGEFPQIAHKWEILKIEEEIANMNDLKTIDTLSYNVNNSTIKTKEKTSTAETKSKIKTKTPARKTKTKTKS